MNYQPQKRDAMKRHFLVQVLLVASLVSASVVGAQSVKITGSVQDSKNGSALVGANVYLIGTSLGAATNDKGRYTITSVKPGTYLIRADYIGYLSRTDTLVVSGEMNLEKVFSLRYTAVQGEEVVVTAQAKGQMDAINRQLSAKAHVSIVSSDRIQELPDANAAESVARIPGVTMKREGGEGNKIVIRGLSPKYNAITVDGVRLAATDSSDRSTDLSMVSQYMLEGIEVTKAGTPDQDADVLGGTVNFRLKRAKSGFRFNGLTQGMHNGLKDSYKDYKLVFDISKRFWNDRVGILGLIDFENRNRSSQELTASYANQNAELDQNNPIRTTGLGLYDIVRQNDRKNGLFVADINIPGGNLSYSNLRSSINKDETPYYELYSLTANSRDFYSGRGNTDLTVETQILEYEQTLFSKLHLDAAISRSKSTNASDLLLFQFHEVQAYTQSVQDVSIANIQSVTKNDTGGTFFNQYTFRDDASEETERTFRFDLGYDFRLFNRLSGSLKAGVKFREKIRELDRDFEYAPITYVGVPDVRDSLVSAFPRIDEFSDFGQTRFTYNAFLDPNYRSGEFLNGDFTIGPFADLDFLEELFHFLRENYNYAPYHENVMHRFHATNSRLFDYTGEENYSAGYAMLDIDLRSNLNVITGFRAERNKTNYQSFRGYQNVLPHFTFNGYDKYSHDRENDFVLPALFVRYRPFSWLEARIARTETLTRPNYADIIPLYNVIGNGASVDYRDADLEPARSKNIDVSFSINQNHIGWFSFGYFEKNINGLIYSSGRRYIENAALYGLPEETEKYYIQNYTSNNPNDVKLRGFEFDYQTRFWFLPGFLNGLVFNANYTVTRSDVKYPRTIVEFNIDFGPPLRVVGTNIDTFYVDRLIDQPNQIMNFSLGYDYKGFSSRLSMLYKSDIFSQTNFWPELRESTDGYRRWDLSIKQTLPANGWAAYLNVSNISGSLDVNRLLDATNALGLKQHYGSTVDLGLRYAFGTR